MSEIRKSFSSNFTGGGEDLAQVMERKKKGGGVMIACLFHDSLSDGQIMGMESESCKKAEQMKQT